MEREKLVKTVTLAQSGDSDALNELFNAFYNDVYYFALKNVKDEDLACDITQEAFVEIINTLGSLKEPAAFVTWMKQITYHQCTRYFKKKKDVLVDENEDGDTIFDTMAEERTEFIPDEAVDQEDFRTTIMGMIDQLPDEQRAATMMYYFDEMSVKEIAQAQGVGENTVKGRLSYSRKAIKKSVEDYEKKNNVKLHCVGLLPLLLWLFRNYGKAMPIDSAKAVAEGVSTATGVGICVAAGSGVVTTAVTTTATVGLGAKLAAIPLFVKITAAVVAVAVAISAVAIALGNKTNNNPVPTISIQNQTTAPREDNLTIPSHEDEELFDPTEKPTTPSDEATAPPKEPTSSSEEETPEPPSEDVGPNDPSEEENTDISPEDTEVDTPTEDEESGYRYYVPMGCTYTAVTGEVFNGGELVTVPCTAGDKFTDGEYTYYYNLPEYPWNTNEPGYLWDTWFPVVIDNTKTSYEPLAQSINGEVIDSLDSTYRGCSNLEVSPDIPKSVTWMQSTFMDCTSLKIAPVLPEGVEMLRFAFDGCTSLIAAPQIPNSVKDMVGTFSGCTSLTNPSNISENAVAINSVYEDTAITEAPYIPDSVVDMSYAFRGCASLVTPSNFPSNVECISYAYAFTAITTAPSIPDSVLYMNGVFTSCSLLETATDFPPNVIDITAAYNSTAITKAPVIPDSVRHAAYTFAWTEITTAPVIPANVITAYQIFYGCYELQGEVVIHAELGDTYIDNIGNSRTYARPLELFREYYTLSVVLTGTSSQLNEIAAQYDNVTVKQ